MLLVHISVDFSIRECEKSDDNFENYKPTDDDSVIKSATSSLVGKRIVSWILCLFNCKKFNIIIIASNFYLYNYYNNKAF